MNELKTFDGKSVGFAKKIAIEHTAPVTFDGKKVSLAKVETGNQQATEIKPKATLGDNLSAIGHSFLTGLADVGSSLYEAADFIIPNEAVSQIFLTSSGRPARIH